MDTTTFLAKVRHNAERLSKSGSTYVLLFGGAIVAYYLDMTDAERLALEKVVPLLSGWTPVLSLVAAWLATALKPSNAVSSSTQALINEVTRLKLDEAARAAGVRTQPAPAGSPVPSNPDPVTMVALYPARDPAVDALRAVAPPAQVATLEKAIEAIEAAPAPAPASAPEAPRMRAFIAAAEPWPEPPPAAAAPPATVHAEGQPAELVDFEIAFKRLHLSEGGYSIRRDDRGNWTTGVVGRGELKGTKFGISAMTYPDLDIARLTLEQAKAIYRRDWWDRIDAEGLGGAITFQLWDMAVNTGMAAAVRALQRAARVADDGDVGPLTQAAVRRMALTDVLFRFNSQRIRYYAKLAKARDNLGWFVRVADRLDDAATDS